MSHVAQPLALAHTNTLLTEVLPAINKRFESCSKLLESSKLMQLSVEKAKAVLESPNSQHRTLVKPLDDLRSELSETETFLKKLLSEAGSATSGEGEAASADAPKGLLGMGMAAATAAAETVGQVIDAGTGMAKDMLEDNSGKISAKSHEMLVRTLELSVKISELPKSSMCSVQ
mmetsp:Transcript_58328/g.126083  ORF Transcript_58328/g.126083 Transcript_58328/m.126083 type:complete len:174 (+) Transcript_58328:61-582(+)|eukprot:CAMPEP_0170603974 /NCGR_PEP_ID=MMETSP0224-20130122/19185_1 /TAXON_ID=285029 /ORGANISM="Togula jolla, Strain CCCM 725" /LENGTH=173 /DNA_ID=CAMNT_0010928865 /DNA_START=56 /DNA_END=577 /DNA_ORIENTATION=+